MTTTGEPDTAPDASQSAHAPLDLEAIQKRTMRTLLLSQASGGVGLVATYIVTALLAKDITGGNKALSTVAAACLSIGAAAVSFPMSKLATAYGRRVSLLAGYLVGSTGAAIALLAAITRSYPLLCLGVLGAGAGNAANLATRYAASDLAAPERRARTISTIVWATTIGSTTGSVVSGTASDIGEKIGLPIKGGSYLLSGLMFLVAAAIVQIRLRPDPLVLAGGVGRKNDVDAAPRQSAKESLALIMANPAARLAVGAMIVSQVTMVGVMSLTPLHMDEGGQGQGIIGWMMAFHIWGMYLFSPIIGRMTDRIGQYPMLYIAGALCTAGAAWAAVTPPEGQLGVFMGNFFNSLLPREISGRPARHGSRRFLPKWLRTAAVGASGSSQPQLVNRCNDGATNATRIG